jgi:hypothetical protein
MPSWWCADGDVVEFRVSVWHLGAKWRHLLASGSRASRPATSATLCETDVMGDTKRDTRFFLSQVGVGESAADEEHAESVVVEVAEAAGDAAVEFDEAQNPCPSRRVGGELGGCVEVAVDLAGEVAFEAAADLSGPARSCDGRVAVTGRRGAAWLPMST